MFPLGQDGSARRCWLGARRPPGTGWMSALGWARPHVGRVRTSSVRKRLGGTGELTRDRTRLAPVVRGMPRRWAASLGAVLTLSSLSGDCGGNAGGDDARRVESAPLRCAVGRPPAYFVPAPAESPPLLLGCARLGVSGERVEFSAHRARIAGASHLCIDPAFSGRGRRGFFIPGRCSLRPPSRFAVEGRPQPMPRPGVDDYAFVIWGTAPTGTRRVVARFEGGAVRAAVFRVRSRLADRLRERPFTLWVLELPLKAACSAVTVRLDPLGTQAGRQARPTLCRRVARE